MKVLIVDDARWQRSNLTKILSAAGHEVVQAADGSEALERVAAEHPQVVVCDLLMPRLDGFGFLEQMRVRQCDVPVVIASADIQETSRLRCQELGARAFVPKPYQPAEILAAIAVFG